jgi:hypothetical protein
MNKTTLNKNARLAGFLYLVAGGCMAFTELYVRSNLISSDASITSESLLGSEMLFRIGLVVDLVGMTVFVFLPLVLYKIFRDVNRKQALLMVVLALISVPIMCVNTASSFAALVTLSGADFLTAFSTDQRNALALLFLTIHSYGFWIAQIFFGLWLIPLGLLIIKSRYLPRIIGLLCIIAAIGYQVDSLTVFLAPEYSVAINPFALAPAAFAELGVIFWLLAFGVKAGNTD